VICGELMTGVNFSDKPLKKAFVCCHHDATSFLRSCIRAIKKPSTSGMVSHWETIFQDSMSCTSSGLATQGTVASPARLPNFTFS
jgi:hypothetical protein